MLFEIKAEVRDSAVTLSAALAKYMVMMNQGDEKELRVMPFHVRLADCSFCKECVDGAGCPMFDFYGWDINPKPGDIGLEEDDLQGMEVLQWNEEERSVGFLMNNPNVTGLLVTYGMREELLRSMDTGREVKLYVRPRMMYGRTQYIIERMTEDSIGLKDRLEVWWTRIRVRWMK